MNVDIARTGLHADRGAAAVDLASDVVLIERALHGISWSVCTDPEPVEASSVKPVLPGHNSTLPEPVSSFQSPAGEPLILMSPEPVPARSAP